MSPPVWRYVPHEPERPVEPVVFGRMLADLHTVLRDFPGELPEDAPALDVRRSLALLEPADLPPGPWPS